jgi:hypothetical protein
MKASTMNNWFSIFHAKPFLPYFKEAAVVRPTCIFLFVRIILGGWNMNEKGRPVL